MRSTTLPRLAVAALATALAGSLALGAPTSSASASGERAPAAATHKAAPGARDRAVDAAAAYVRNHSPAGRQSASPGRATAHAGTKGTYYVSYQRSVQGLPVYGADVVVAVDAAGRATGATGTPGRPLSVRSTTPTRTRAQARATARRQVDAVRSVSRPTLTVYAVGTPRLAWLTTVKGTDAGSPSIKTVYSDARTGAVLLASEGVHEGTGNGYYYPGVTIGTSGSGTSYSMTDPTRSGVKCGGQNGAAYTGTDNVWGNGSGTSLETACVDVLYSVGKEVDMLSAWLGRNGVKGNGTNYPSQVGLADVNAYFDGTKTNFGHSQDNARQLAAIDIVAHENGHGIFETTPGGSTGGNETGGLNEATGDIFGALTEFYAGNPNDPGDYLVGEEANLVGQGPIRNMANPSALGDPNCYSSAISTTEVHSAAGPLNHWFYLLANGTSGSTSCNGSTLTGIGIQNAGKVFYNGLLLKTSSWTHAKARVATLTAAKNLFGTTDCTTFNRVRDAWSAISVPAQTGEPTCGTTTPPTTGTCTEFTSTGTLSSGTSTWKPSTSGFSTAGGVINACLTGASGTDFDLYLQKYNGSSWVDVAASESASSTEKIAYTAGSGTYRIEVYAYAGSGSYTVKYDTP
ncbi:M4 family metallopeptidase [Nocardioides rubriscoriae]|uniref:M4 family metallopeptidase n=1 Tax=Nocardioides rubriscoriae TaxID=642762 RepID=UPI0011DF3170|nr:M4 family metallopeptidase [Nocardioides rubriscoriae]